MGSQETNMTYWLNHHICMFSSVQFSRSVMSDSLWPHESQHSRPPCPSPTPRVHSNSHPLSRWCHPAISSSVIPFSSCPQSLPASESFPMSQLFAWGGQSTGVSALTSLLPKKSQGWSPSEWTGWICMLFVCVCVYVCVCVCVCVYSSLCYTIGPCCIQSVCNSLHLLPLNSHSFSPTLPMSFGSHNSVMFVSLSVWYINSFVPYFRFHIKVIYMHIYITEQYI